MKTRPALIAVLCSFLSLLDAQINFRALIPSGYEMLDTASGDLDLDGKKDLLLALKIKNEEKIADTSSVDIARPLLILICQPDGKLKLAARNDDVVMCAKCGGVFGDPYSRMVIKNGYFSVEHYGGSNWRWSDIVTFHYDKKTGKWLLHRWGGNSYHTSEPEKVTKSVKTPKEFGVVEFLKFKRDD